jgi:DNA-binding transcriptional ArsR family regulator
MAHGRRTEIEDPREVGLLASPTRIEIVDTLEALGTAVTVAELAGALGRPADGLYYHLRQLADAGLVEEESSVEGRRYRSRTHGSDRLRLRYRPGTTPNADAVARVAASVLRVAGRDFARALADPDTVVEGPRRELWVAHGKGWVDANDLAEINRLLARLMDLVQQPADARRRGRRRLVTLSWVLAPVEARPARRAAPASRRRRTR